MTPIRTKAEMYELLARGSLGNTVRQWFDVAEWAASSEAARYRWWGVRSLTPGGPCRLNCPADEVAETAAGFRAAGHGVNVSLMVDRVYAVTAWLEVWDSPTGLVAYGVERPPQGGSWRQLMPVIGRHWEGVAARMLLRRHLNANSLDDLDAVLALWPGHVVEFGACEECLGVLPGRNAVVWEVRAY